MLNTTKDVFNMLQTSHRIRTDQGISENRIASGKTLKQRQYIQELHTYPNSQISER